MWNKFLVWATNSAFDLRREEGQGTTEYAIVLAIIVIGVITILTAIGVKVESMFNAVKTELGA